MKKFKKFVSSLIIFSMIICSTGFSTLADSLYEEELNLETKIKETKSVEKEFENDFENEQEEKINDNDEIVESIDEKENEDSELVDIEDVVEEIDEAINEAKENEIDKKTIKDIKLEQNDEEEFYEEQEESEELFEEKLIEPENDEEELFEKGYEKEPEEDTNFEEIEENIDDKGIVNNELVEAEENLYNIDENVNDGETDIKEIKQDNEEKEVITEANILNENIASESDIIEEEFNEYPDELEEKNISTQFTIFDESNIENLCELDVDFVDGGIVASISDADLNLLGTGSNDVYWYLTDGDTILHLSGEEPNVPEYSISGGDSYNKDSVTNKTDIVQVIIDNPIHPTNCEAWFREFRNLLSIDYIDKLDTSEVINMSSMFYFCNNLTSLDVSNFNTSEVTNMSLMFFHCEKIENLNVSGFVTNKVTDMNRMFSVCSSLTNVDVSGFDTNEVTNMSCMFNACENLASLDVSNIVTNKVTDMSQMFNKCSSLTSLDVSNFDTSKVTNMATMFGDCSNLANIDVSNFVTSKVTYMFTMFSGCSNLTEIDVSNFDTSQVKNLQMMFDGCSNLTYLDLSNFIINPEAYDVMMNMLNKCINLKRIKISESVSMKINEVGLTGNWKNVDTKQVYNYQSTHTTIPTNLAGEYISSYVYWYLTNSGSELHLSGTKPLAIEYTPGQDYYNKDSIVNKSVITKVVFDNPVSPFNCEAWFREFRNLLSIDYINKLDTSEVTNMSSMFYFCNNLTSLDVSNFNTSEVTNMSLMFFSCEKLEYLNVSGFVTNKVTDMNRMFSVCSSLINIDVSNFVTNEVTNMLCMFNACENLASLDVSNFVTNKVTDMSQMFNKCSSLTSLDVSNFDTSKVTNMATMFNDCSNLANIDVSNFVTSKVTYMFTMFSGCSNLTEIDVSNFDTSQVENLQMMFDGCSNLTYLDLSNFTIDPVAYDRVSNMLNNCKNLKRIKISESVSMKINEVGLTGNWKNVDTKQVYNYQSTHTTIPTDLAGEYICSYVYWYLTNSGSELHLSGTKPSATEYTQGQDYYNKDSAVDKTIITKVVFDDIVSPFNCESWFSWFENLLTIVDIDNLDTSEVINMSNMFYRCSRLTSLDVSNFNTSEVTNMAAMFQECIKINSFDVSNFDTSEVTNMASMFRDCHMLSNLNVSNFDTSEVTNMASMFQDCHMLSNLNVSNFVTNKVTDMSQMFNNCNSLTSLDVSNFVTNKVTNMSQIFANCRHLTEIDVSNFDTSQVANLQKMFDGCIYLTYLDLSNFTIIPIAYDKVSNMLNNCNSLNHIKTSQSLSMKINEVGLTGDWRNASTGIVYYYNGTQTTIPGGIAGEYKKPVTVSFDTNGGSAKTDIIVGYGDKLTTPTDVIKSGYTIENWYKEPAHTNVWDFDNDVVTENITLYADWIYATYIIKYNTNGGTISPTQITKTYNTNVSLISPTKTGYDFDMWYIDNNTFLYSYDGTTDIADTQDAEVEIFAKWLLNSNYVEVNFNSNGGSAVDTQVIEKAIGIVTKPTNPTKNGYTFSNWYKEPALTTLWDFDTMVATESIILYAKWIANTQPHNHSSGSGGGGGGSGVTSKKQNVDPLKENAILTLDKNKNVYVFNKQFTKWKYDVIDNSWGLDVIVDGITVPYIYGYAILDYDTYYFDINCKMVTGWVKDTNGDYYVFEWEKTDREGKMITGWRLINNKWYYFQLDGKLLTNSITPDGYMVDNEGVWVK